MVINNVQVILHGSSLGDELHDLLHDIMGEVLRQEVEDETVGGLEVKVLQMPSVDLSHQDGSEIKNNIKIGVEFHGV